MGENPYKAPTAASGKQPRRQRAINLLKRFPATIAMLVLAATISSYLAAREYRVQMILSQRGTYSESTSDFDRFVVTLGMPGLFPFYVVGTIANSIVCGCLAFVAGMAICYGLAGLAFDRLKAWLGGAGNDIPQPDTE